MLEFLDLVYRAEDARPRHGLVSLIDRLRVHKLNTVGRARSNIHHHYDIGDDFYRLWLDCEMVYTCATSPRPKRRWKRPKRPRWISSAASSGCNPARRSWRPAAVGERWPCIWPGTTALPSRPTMFPASRSARPAKGPRPRVWTAAWSSSTTITAPSAASSNVFASVGMLEHVGLRNYECLGGVIERCLRPGGRGMIHSIGRDEAGPLNAWIERRIFPGVHARCLREIMRVLEPRRFSVLDVENLRLHYAMTLQHWLDRFEAAASRVAEMFDEGFVRAWRLYLAGSLAAFRTGTLQLFQVVFSRHASNEIPWTRKR